MDKIYSRKRFLIPKFKLNRGRIGIKNASISRKIVNDADGVGNATNINNENGVNRISKINNVDRGNRINKVNNVDRVNKINNVNNGNRINKVSRSNRENLTGGNFELKKNLQEKIFNRKLIKTAVIVIIAVYIANRIISTIEPTIDVLCVDMAKSIATKISNEQATVVMRKLQI